MAASGRAARRFLLKTPPSAARRGALRAFIHCRDFFLHSWRDVLLINHPQPRRSAGVDEKQRARRPFGRTGAPGGIQPYAECLDEGYSQIRWLLPRADGDYLMTEVRARGGRRRALMGEGATGQRLPISDDAC